MSSREVVQAVGESELDAQIAELKADLSQPTPRDVKAAQLAELERRQAERARAALTAAAEKRMLGIVRATGSLADQLKQDEHRLLDAARKFAEQVVSTNTRFEKCIGLRHEAQALAEVFGLPVPDLPAIIVPASRTAVQEAFETTSRVGVRDNGFVQATTDAGQRTFEEPELAGTPGRDLIRRKLGK